MGFLSNQWWGLAVPENVTTTTSWGARAIFKPHGIGLDLLGDRQGVRDTGPEDSQSERWAFFARHLNEVAMPIAKEASKTLRSDEGELVTLYEDNILVVQGNTRGSYGYCYLVAWLKEDVPDGVKNPKLLDSSLNKFSSFSSFKELLRIRAHDSARQLSRFARYKSGHPDS